MCVIPRPITRRERGYSDVVVVMVVGRGCHLVPSGHPVSGLPRSPLAALAVDARKGCVTCMYEGMLHDMALMNLSTQWPSRTPG